MQQVSVRSGIPYSVVRSYSWGGSTPTPARLVKLAQALGVPTTALAPPSAAPTLHELRWHAGLTVAQLAQHLGYSVSHTSSVLQGAVPITEPARWADSLNTTQRSVKAAWSTSHDRQAGDIT